MHRSFSGIKNVYYWSCNCVAFGIACLAESVNRCGVGGCGMAGKPVGTTNTTPIPPHCVSVFMSYPPRDFLSPSGVSFFPAFPAGFVTPQPRAVLDNSLSALCFQPAGHLPVEGIVMACCKCCCENGSPPGECCGSPEVCCKDPDVCCGPSGSKTCCEEPRVCCGVGSGQECCPEGDVCCGEDCCPANQECCDDVCCNEGQYCCDGECSDEPCDGCEGDGDCNGDELCCGGQCVPKSELISVLVIGGDCDEYGPCPDPGDTCCPAGCCPETDWWCCIDANTYCAATPCDCPQVNPLP